MKFRFNSRLYLLAALLLSFAVLLATRYFSAPITKVYADVAFGITAFSVVLLVYFFVREINRAARLHYELVLREEYLRETLNSLEEGVIATNLLGIIQNMNPSAEQLTGWKSAEAAGLPLQQVYNVVNEETGLKFKNIVSRILEKGEAIEFENNTILYQKGGGQIIISNSGSPVKDVAGKIVGAVLVFRDLTSKKVAQATLVKANHHLQNILNQSMDIICTIDSEGRFVTMNAASEKLWGFTPDELIGKPFIDFVCPEDVTMTAQMAAKIAEGESQTNFENRYIHKDGHLVPVIWSSRWDKETNTYYAVARDGTERKEAEEKLVANEKRFRALIENSADMKTLADPDGKITYASPSVAKILGYPLEEFLKIPATELLHPDDIKQIGEKIEAILQAPANSFYSRHRLRHKMGHWIWAEGTMTNMLHEPSINGLVSNFRDISDKKEAEEKLQKSYTDLEAYSLTQSSILDALPANIALLNQDGVIVDVNEAWIRFGHENSLRSAAYSIGDNYIDIADNASGDAAPIGKQIAMGIKSVINGSLPYFDLEYSCHSPSQQRWFVAEVAPLMKKHGAGAVVMHIDVTERKLYEEKIKASELNYRSLIEQASDAVVILNAELGFEEINAAAETLFGYSKQEIMQLKVTDLMRKEEAVIIATNVEKLRAGQEVRYERMALKKDGHAIEIELNAKMMADGRVMIFARDITARKKYEKQLQDSHEFILKLTDQVPVAVYRFEMTADGKMSFPFMGMGIERILPGLSADKVIVDPALPFSQIHPDELQGFLASIEHSRQTLTPWQKEYRVITAAGEIKWLQAESRPEQGLNGTVIWHGYIQDITEQIEAREKLAATNLELETLFNTIDEVLFSVDLVNYRTLQMSAACQKVFGYLPEEYFANPDLWRQIVHPDDLHIFDTVAQTMESGGQCEMNYRIIHKDASVRWIETTITPTLNAEGKLVRVDGVSRDVTVRKQAEEVVLKMNELLEERVKQRTAELTEANEALEAFSYSVSHDLRSPVRTLIGFTQIIKTEFEEQLNEELKNLFGHVYSSSRRMDAIINDLLMLSRYSKEPVKHTIVNTTQLVNAVWDKITIANPHRAKLTVGELPNVRGDLSMLEQVLVNLLSNAIKYSSKKDNPEVTVGCDKTDTGTIFYIKDNGAGFEMKYYDRMFGAFQRLHGSSEFEGTGVGLNIVKRIVDKHNGRIWAESKVDEGATFYFTLETV
ncbi:MAG TPA: PAS domain S-box protein [Chitinophagales bacterium]|nr:PAS domain S-box protein [Chitinophagales bacterium]